MKIDKMKRLKRISFQVNIPILIDKKSGEKSSYFIQNLKECEHAYFIYDRQIIYVDQGKIYTLPYLEEAEQILKENKFKFIKMELPFSAGNQPSDGAQQERWKELNTIVQILNEKAFEAKCLKFAQKSGIRELPEHVLSNCYLIRKEGSLFTTVIDYKYGDGYHQYVETPLIIFPILTDDDKCIENKVGHYQKTRNSIKFVNADGKTYFAMLSDELEEELNLNGFVQDTLFENEIISFFEITRTIGN